MRDDGRVKQSGGFKRVLTGEECADVELTRLRKRASAKEVGFNAIEVATPNCLNLVMAFTEFSGDCCELVLRLRFAERKRAAQNVDGPRGICGNEGTEQYSRIVRSQGNSGRMKG